MARRTGNPVIAAAAAAAVLLALSGAGCAPEPSPPSPSPSPPPAASANAAAPADPDWAVLERVSGVGQGNPAAKVDVSAFAQSDSFAPGRESVSAALSARTVDSAPFEVSASSGSSGSLRLRVTLDSRDSLPHERQEDNLIVTLVRDGTSGGGGTAAPGYSFKAKPTPGRYAFVRPVKEKVAPGTYHLSVNPVSRTLVSEGGSVENAYAWKVVVERKR